ncbi:WbqC family protein [Fulvivirga sp. 29W222]|uniref:WbqC family protein n=2 Tax=Fulvivirga marina TaxID=2494733 RepID=A0A937KC07_9BACT|nr:WbqC family protein [Fulvivirga marina]
MSMPDKKTALIDIHYLPCIEYFTCLKKFDTILIEKEEYYIKQTYRNRCHLLSANKVERLSVPVVGGNKKIKIKDIKISYKEKWYNDHWRTIMSAYGRAPFYEFFSDYFEGEFQKREKFLFDFNLNLLTLCLKLLQIDPVINFTDKFEKKPESNIIDLRSVIHPKQRYEQNAFYHPQPYQQVFGSTFVANLSIIDLLFCEGPNAAATVTNSMA